MKTRSRMWRALITLVCLLGSMAQATATEKTADLKGHVRSLGFSKSVPKMLNYQGYLADASDTSAVNGVLEMTFRLYDDETGGVELWSETHPAVSVVNGNFAVLLGEVTSLPEDLTDGSSLWLETQVESEVLSPRKPLVSVAYGIRAQTADYAVQAQHAFRADTAAYSQSVDGWTVVGDDICRETGKVGIGTSSPSYTLDVAGAVKATTYFGNGSNLTGINRAPDEDWTVSGDDMYAGVSGNVGIGITTPAYRLDVAGAVNATTYYGDGSHLTGIAGEPDDDWVVDGEDIHHLMGNVGIGTSSPSYLLDVAGAMNATTYYGDGSHLTGISGTGDNDWIIDGDEIYHQAGRVGIGTSSPAEKLHVAGNVKVDSTTFTSKVSSNSPLRLQTAGTTRLYVDDTTGNVGIGITTPAYRLDVAGAVNATTYYGDGSHLTGITGTTDNDWTIDGDNIYHEAGQVGIGTTNPEAKLHIEGGGLENALFAKGGWSYPILAEYEGSDSAAAICARNTGASGDAIVAIAEGSGKSAIHALAAPGIDYVVWAEADSDSWAGYFSGDVHASGKVGIGTASPSAKLDIDGGGLENALMAKGSWSYPIVSEWGGSGEYAAVLAKNTGTSGDAIQAIAEGSGRSAIYAQATTGADYTIWANANGANWAGFFTGDVHASGQVGIGTTVLGSHALSVFSSGSGESGSTVHVENDAPDGTALSLENSSTDVTLLISQHGTGDMLLCEDGQQTVFKVQNDGRIIGAILELTGGSDLSEQFDVQGAGSQAKPGMLVCIDPERPGELILSTRAYDRRVAGIISGAGGIEPGMLMGQSGSVADGQYPVALTGRVYCWTDASNGAIEPGDLLTTSNIPGHAMKVVDHAKAQGAIIGKAMSSLEQGRGLVLVLVTLQ